jgi:hypothetical protein
VERAVHDPLVLAGAEAGEAEDERPREGARGVVRAVHGREQRQRVPARVLHAVRGAERHPVPGRVGEALSCGSLEYIYISRLRRG